MTNKQIPIYCLVLVAMLSMLVQADSTALQSVKLNATMSMVDLGNGEVLINYDNATTEMYMLGENVTVHYDQQLHYWNNGTFTISMTGRGNLTNPIPLNLT